MLCRWKKNNNLEGFSPSRKTNPPCKIRRSQEIDFRSSVCFRNTSPHDNNNNNNMLSQTRVARAGREEGIRNSCLTIIRRHSCKRTTSPNLTSLRGARKIQTANKHCLGALKKRFPRRRHYTGRRSVIWLITALYFDVPANSDLYTGAAKSMFPAFTFCLMTRAASS